MFGDGLSNLKDDLTRLGLSFDWNPGGGGAAPPDPAGGRHGTGERPRRGAVIAYFDTSALIALVVDEAGSGRAARLWDEAERVVTVRLAYPEGRAALAKARRSGRLTTRATRTARRGFEDVWRRLDRVEVTATLAQQAGDLAEELGLRGYDAVHLAAAATIADPDLVVVAGHGPLCDAARTLGLAVSRT